MSARQDIPIADEYFLLWVLIAQTKDAILRARERDYARYGISNDRRAVLYVIESNGGVATPVEISRSLFRELHSVTEMLKRMEEDGLIVREKAPGRSRIQARLTEQGLDVFYESLHNGTDERIFSALTKAERKRLWAYLLKVRTKVLQDLGIPEWQIDTVIDPHVPAEPESETAGHRAS
jgi:DNA-binding MarR family transcriptional regulator